MRDLNTTELERLEHQYKYHAPTQDQIERYTAIREAAKNLEAAILRACPDNPDRQWARRQVHAAAMVANRSIALHRE